MLNGKQNLLRFYDLLGSMKELALGKKLLGVALTTKLPVSNEPLPLPWQYLFSYGIYLYENSSNSSLNAALCQHKIADSFGPMYIILIKKYFFLKSKFVFSIHFHF